MRRVDPLIELELLRIGTFTGGSLVLAMFQFEKMTVLIFLSLYLQHQGKFPTSFDARSAASFSSAFDEAVCQGIYNRMSSWIEVDALRFIWSASERKCTRRTFNN